MSVWFQKLSGCEQIMKVNLFHKTDN